jgi:hypothetical protein
MSLELCVEKYIDNYMLSKLWDGYGQHQGAMNLVL